MGYKNIIIDLRDNTGGNTPTDLFKLLMNKPYRRFEYREIKQRSVYRVLQAAYLRQGKFKKSYKIFKAKGYKARRGAYEGRIFILVNYGTMSAAEDFAYPFKESKRGMLIGIKTLGSNGSTYMYDFENGIKIGVGVMQVRFPNGFKFEGVGIAPDKEVYPTIDEIKACDDVILKRAIYLAKKQC